MKVQCHACGRTVKLELGDYLKAHRALGRGYRCEGSGRHVDFNIRKEN
jgi:hypothetical protein